MPQCVCCVQASRAEPATRRNRVSSKVNSRGTKTSLWRQRVKKAILSWTLYAWNDDELIAPHPADPVQLLFCILYAWNDDELIAPLPRTRFSFYFEPYIWLEWWWINCTLSLTDPVQLLFCTQYAWNDDELNCPSSYGPGSAFILHPICLAWWWINCTPSLGSGPAFILHLICLEWWLIIDTSVNKK